MICPNYKNKEVFDGFNEIIEALGGKPMTEEEFRSSELRNQRTGLDYSAMEAAYKLYHRNGGNFLDLAPNGKTSILFLTLLSEFGGDRVAAIKAKSAVYSDRFRKWFGDWIRLYGIVNDSVKYNIITPEGEINWEYFESLMDKYHNKQPDSMFAHGRYTLSTRPENHFSEEKNTLNHIKFVTKSMLNLLEGKYDMDLPFVSEARASLKNQKDLMILAAMFHDVAKPYRHGDIHGWESADILRDVLGLNYNNRLAEWAVRHHMPMPFSHKADFNKSNPEALEVAKNIARDAKRVGIDANTAINAWVLINAADVINGRELSVEDNWAKKAAVNGPTRYGNDLSVKNVLSIELKEKVELLKWAFEQIKDEDFGDTVYNYNNQERFDYQAFPEGGREDKKLPYLNNESNVSKVVDENGEPLVVYHRSPNEFTTFDVNRIGTTTDEGQYGKGFYFSDKPNRAEGTYIYPVFLNIRNPYIVDDNDSHSFVIANSFNRIGEISKISGTVFGSRLAEDEKALINSKDGVIEDTKEEFVVKNPNQIKSATGNIEIEKPGTGFSTTNDDIYDNGESVCDCSSVSTITGSTQIKQSLQNLNKQDNNFARPALIKHYIDKSRDIFILTQVDKYTQATKNPTSLDIYGVKIGSAIDWDELKIKLIINEQQEKLAKVYGLKKQKRPDGTYIYVSSDKSKDTRLRIAFVNSMTGLDWVDEDGTTHKGLFYEGSKFEECAWNSIYISITDGDPTTFVHEMIHYYIRTFWDSQVVQDALRSIDDLKDRKRTNSEEDLQYSKKLEEKLVNTISESTMWNKNRSLVDKFWDGINNILKNIIGISLKNDKNASGNIIDTLNAAFSINQDLSDRKAETLYYYKYAGAVAQSQITPLLDQPDSFEGTTFWKIKLTLESRVKSEKSRGKSASEELLDFMQKLRRRSGFVKEDVYNTVIDFLLLAYGDVREAKNVLLDLKTKSSEELANADAGEIMHLRHDIISYYDKILVDVVDEYVNKNKDLSEEDIDFFKRHRTSLQKDINELKSQFNDILSAYVDVKIEQYGNELVSMGDKDIFIANMKLWARNAIDNGNLMPFENIIGTAVTSYSPIVRLVEYIVTAQNRITYTNSLEKGHELIDKYKKCASVKDKLLSINFMKQFCELDDDGNPTGYFVRKYNLGKLYKKRDDVIKKLVKKYNLLVDKDTGKINFEDKNLYVKYITDFYNELDKFVNFRYKKEYYIERAKILSPKAIELQQSIQSLINILLNKATDEELGVPFIFNLTSDEILTLEKLRKEKQNLSNPYIITYNSDGSISDIIEKTGEQLLIALEFIQWNAYKANKIKYKSNWDKFKEVKEKIKNKYGENSPELKLFERKYMSRRISSQFYEDLNMPKTDDPRLIELYSRKSAIINSIKNKRGYYQPNLKKLNDLAFAELKRIDEEISNLSYSSYDVVEEKMGELQGKSKFNDIAVKRWVGEYKNGRLTTEPVINYFYNLERSRRLAQGIPQDLISDYTYISSDGKIRPLSVFKYTLPKSEDYLEYTLLNEFSELDPTSELLNQDFDVNENEEMLPKVRKDFLNETWQKIQNDENLKAFYDEILKTMHESYSMLPNMDADKMQYIMPQMRDRDAKLLFRNRHILNNMGASIADAFSITERETLYNEDFSKRPDGSYVETIPIRWITRLKDPTIISTDILQTVTMFYEMANNYRNKAEINPLLQMILFRTQGGFNTQAPGTEYSKQSQRIQNYLQMYVYGRTRTGISDPNKPMTERERKMSRMTETVLRVAHRKLMSHNWRAVLKNFVDSLLTDIAEIYTGKYITTEDSIFGVGLMGSEIIDLLSSFGKANNKSLIAALMQLNGCSGTISEIFGLHNETWIRRVISKHASMGEYNFIDYTFKGHYVASLYHSIRLVKNPNTKKLEYLTKDQAMYHYQAAGLKMEDGLKAWKKAKITLINAYELDNKGNAVVKEKYKKYVYPHVESLGRSTNRLVNQVAGTIRERTSVINGILDKSNSVRAQQVTIGAMLLLMRGWMITQGWDNFKDGHDFGEYVEQWKIMLQSSQEAYNDVYMPGYINKKVNVDETKYTLVNEDPELRGQYNFETGSVELGQWRELNVATKNYMEDVILNLVIAYKHIRRIEDSAEYKNKLTRNQRYKLRRLSAMISTFIITAACTYFTTMLTIKWPKKWFLDLLSAANISVISERASLLPVFALFSILDIVNSIVISKTIIEDADKFIDLIMDIIEASKDHIAGKEDTKYNEKINTGAYAGLERWLRDLIKATSYTPYNVDNVFRSMTESGNKASINYYIHNVSPTKQAYEASRFFVPWALEKVGVDIEEPEWVKQSSKKKKKNSVVF